MAPQPMMPMRTAPDPRAGRTAGLLAAMDAMPELEFGNMEQPQRVPGLDAVTVMEETQHFVDVVDPAFTGSPAGQDVAQGVGEDAGHPRVQRCGKAHLLNTISHRVRYPAAQTAAEQSLIPDSLHLAVRGHAERKGDQAVVHEGQTCLHPVGHRVAIFHPEILWSGSPFHGASQHGVQVGVLVARVARRGALDKTWSKPALLLEPS